MEASRLAWRELVLPVSREAGIAWFQNSWSLRPGLHWAMIPIYCLNSISLYYGHYAACMLYMPPQGHAKQNRSFGGWGWGAGAGAGAGPRAKSREAV